VLEHLEAQLHMALQLLDDVDKLWLEDVKSRNRSQLEALRAFEDKCRRLTSRGCTSTRRRPSRSYWRWACEFATAERMHFESRSRRLKLACARWNAAYQQQMHLRYHDLCAALKECFMR
jgi:hypothetical protein